MKNAKKWITLNNKIGKLDTEISKYDRGLKVDFIKKNQLEAIKSELIEEQYFLSEVLTDKEKEYINDYYQCEMFEI